MEIGKKLKKFRNQNNLTLEELASRCELSKGFLSQIENDLTSPSIATLNDIVEVLGTDLSSFFKDDKEDKVIFTNEDYFVDEQDDKIVNWIVPNAQKNEMEPILLELFENGESDEIIPHEGEEFGYVLEGKVTLMMGNQKLKLKKGQTFYLTGEEVHSLKNENKQVAKVIWVCTPPIF